MRARRPTTTICASASRLRLAPRSLDALLALLGRLDAWGLRVIFLIDDFDRVTPALKRADFDHLRALLMAASLVIVTRKALSKLVPAEVQTSPFFNLVQRLDLRSLYFWPPEEARRMITEPPKWLTPQFRVQRLRRSILS